MKWRLLIIVKDFGVQRGTIMQGITWLKNMENEAEAAIHCLGELVCRASTGITWDDCVIRVHKVS